MKGYYTSRYTDAITLLKKGCWLAFLLIGVWGQGCKKEIIPVALGTSPSGQLSRYDLIAADYDIKPVTSFTASYNQEGRMVNLFEKMGQSLFSFNLSYEGNKLVSALANDKSVQQITYDAGGKPLQVNYTTLTDTGKLVYTYSATGKLIALLDSVQKPLKLPARLQYLFTYDPSGNNVVKITTNQLDMKGRPTLLQYSFYTFDDKLNPFTAFPYLQYSNLLPGEVPALVNKNNVTSSRLVGTLLNSAGSSSAPEFDTITIYRTTRTYEYTDNGFPAKAIEHFENVQFNYSGKRTFKYEY
ncbi:hypothetical protein [Chitinophaga sp. 212800010-3]|uniref:hypothetical protein n=1 Tax=unclassified Chitinophaga TaxID=2619133 RepID=UPI002DE430B1|nr:YD repeat-containing protein [Chitinophaga sp. 212800010-3]